MSRFLESTMRGSVHIMNKKKLLIISVTIIVATAILFAGIIIYNSNYCIPYKPDSIEGSLELAEVNESACSLTFVINITESPDWMPLDSDRDVILISVSANKTILSSLNYSWNYLDLNNDNQINTGDEIIIHIDNKYYIQPIGVGMLVSYAQGGLVGGWE